MDNRVGVPAARGRAVEGTTRDPLAAKLHALVHPTDVDTGEDALAVREPFRQVRRRLNTTDAGNERSRETLDADHGVHAGPSNRGADVGRPADARFDGQPRHPRDHFAAVLEIVVRQREIAVVADERRPEKSRVAVVAAARDPKGRAIPAAPDADYRMSRPEEPLAIRFDHLEAIGIWIRGSECVGVIVRSSAPRPFGEEADAALDVAERAELHGRGGSLFFRRQSGAHGGLGGQRRL